MADYQLIVIGAGPGGYTAALRAAKLGLHTAVIEDRECGGTCLNRGCVPTKALLHASQVWSDAHHCAGVCADGASLDLPALYRHKDEISQTLSSGIEGLFRSAKITLLRGRARITAPGCVEITGQDAGTVTADHILIATGSVPARPPIPGLELAMTSDELLKGTDRLYRSIVIMGGGVIGVEFAQVFSDLGREITILEALPRILNNMDREISQNLTMILKKRGVSVHTGAGVSRIEADEGGLTCFYTEKGQETQVFADCVLVCTGRKPETEQLFAPGAEVPSERGFLRVNSDFETGLSGVYAVGDVVLGGIQLAHAAENQAKNAVRAMFGAPRLKDLSLIPACVFTDPEIAAVGITADEAKAADREVIVRKSLTSANGKSVVEGAERGFAKLVFDRASGVLVGAQLMCPHAAEMIGGLTAAIVGGLTEAQIARTVFPHPTVSEILSLD